MSQKASSNPDNTTSRKSTLALPLTFAGFVLLPVATYFFLQPRPDVGGFNALDAERAVQRLEIKNRVEQQALEDLGLLDGAEYAWVDKSVGLVRIPVSLAMKITAEQLASNEVRPADFVDAVTAQSLGITPDSSVLAPANTESQGADSNTADTDSNAGPVTSTSDTGNNLEATMPLDENTTP